jgi:cobalamin biosynthesis protein CbiD
MQLVETVASNAKFHSSQDRTSQSTVTNVFQSINQHLEEAQVAEDLEVEVAAEVATEEALTEDHEKCTKRLVETVARIVKFHSSQNRTSQSTAANAFKVIKEIKDNYTSCLLDHE